MPSRASPRIASVDEASRLLAAPAAEDRALWTTAFYAGVRRTRCAPAAVGR
jgi:hypothetical protein